MKYAYIRVSTTDQNTARQFEALKHLEIPKENTYEEKISGKDTKRPELQRMLSKIAQDDVIYVESLSRLGRSTLDLYGLMTQIKESGAKLIGVKEGFNISTSMGKAMFGFLAIMAELERDNIKERQREGIAIAKERGTKSGKPFGRPKQPNPPNWDRIKADVMNGAITAIEGAKRAGIGKTKFYQLMQH